ncbi:MAG: FadR/GntR family transcriptional regulator [Pseudomonadota bacterium]
MGAPEIAAHLRREITSGTLKQNDRLPAERRLAENYGVARGTVREAIQRLEQESFVETRPGSGTYVAHMAPDSAADAVRFANPLELIDARFALEPHVCRLAILHGRREDFEALERLCDRMEGYELDAHAFSEADTQFHHALAQSTRNGLLIWIISQINQVRSQDEWTLMRHLTLDAQIIREYNVQHRAVLDALRQREPEAAAQAMKGHLESSRLSLTRAAAT